MRCCQKWYSYWTRTPVPHVFIFGIMGKILFFPALNAGKQTCECPNGRENPTILAKGMFGEEWWELVLFAPCPYPQPLGWFHKGKEGGEKSVRISQLKYTSTLTEIDCFLLRNLAMVTIIFLNLSSCLQSNTQEKIMRRDLGKEFLQPSSLWECLKKEH